MAGFYSGSDNFGGGGGGFGGPVPAAPASGYYPYFFEGEGIDRSVVHNDLPRYIGNNAISRPGERDGVEGYWYGGGRTALTEAQVCSLKADSAKFRAEEETARRYNRFPPGYILDYEHSDAYRDSYYHNYDGGNPDLRYLDDGDLGPRQRDGRQNEGRQNEGRQNEGRQNEGRQNEGRQNESRQFDGRQHPVPGTQHPPLIPPRSTPDTYPSIAPDDRQDPRYLYMPPPDNRPWFDTVRGVYLPPFLPPPDPVT